MRYIISIITITISFQVQEQETSAMGTSLSFSLDQPIVSVSGRVGFVRWACFYIIAWKWALLICNRAASLVGGRACGDRHLENNVARASLQLLSAAATLLLCRWTSRRTSLSGHPGHHFLGFSAACGVLWASSTMFSCYGQQIKVGDGILPWDRGAGENALPLETLEWS